MTITEQDKSMGGAIDITFTDGEAPRVNGARICSYSVNDLRAYADLDLPGTGLAYWELTPEQADLLVAKAPKHRLHAEVVAEASPEAGGERAREARAEAERQGLGQVECDEAAARAVLGRDLTTDDRVALSVALRDFAKAYDATELDELTGDEPCQRAGWAAFAMVFLPVGIGS